jgi:nicotinate-nucleotide adenylyltransferase
MFPETKAMTLPGRQPPAWIYLHGIKSALSSTAIRNGKKPPVGG